MTQTDTAEIFPLIIAHRGSSARAPENTFAAFRQALTDGADGIEFDVRLAKNDEVVVFHDASLRRLTGRREKVADLSVAELGRTDVGAWFNPRGNTTDFSGETIPTLAATLDLLRNFDGLIYIELKCNEAESARLAAAVCGIVRGFPDMIPRIIIKSFQPEVLPHVEIALPEVRKAALFAPKIMTILRKEKRLVNIAGELGAQMLSVHFSLATKKLMKKAARRDLPVTIWTADNPRWVKRALNLGLYAIITNDPAPLIARRAELLAA